MTDFSLLCTEPWSEIIPNLWVGCHDYQTDETPWAHAIVGAQFDVVLSLYEQSGHGPDAGVPHLFLRIPDGNLSGRDLDDVRALADLAAEAVRDGKRVLCRCQAGLNRSSLVAALAMVRLGYHQDAAIELIRRKRSPRALFNEHFQRYIAEDARRPR